MADLLKKVTAPGLRLMKQQKQKIVTLTCYDFPTAKMVNAAGVDVALVGDSLGMVKLGYRTTLPVTMDDMIYHTRIVARGNSRALLVSDMPYLSYHVSPKQAVENGGKLLKAGAEAVKLEGGREMVPMIEALRRAKIPVMGHLGLTPQSVHLFGGFKVQGRDKAAAKKLLNDAKAIEKAGVFAVVLECIPDNVARAITRAVSIPTIGIGAGAGCDGQVLVIDDLLGLTPDPIPRFVKRYAQLRDTIFEAAAQYGRDVRAGTFPGAENVYR